MDFIANTGDDIRRLLSAVNASSIEELFEDVPDEVRLKGDMNLPPAMDEASLLTHMKNLAQEIHGEKVIFLGAGSYDHFIPTAVNHIISRSDFYTAYTPYQAEVSQGTLQAIYEYQSAICELTAMDVANASLYDGGSALAEGARMAIGATGRNKVLIPKNIHPAYRRVVATYLAGIDVILEEVDFEDGIINMEDLKKKLDKETACLLLQQPNFFGCLEEVQGICELVHDKGALMVVSVNPISLGLLKPPGHYGADIVVGEGQPLGLPMSFGGPYLGFMACSEKLLRRMPGRIAGRTTDDKGNPGFVLTLQTREQHIRRERATSNICSNQALCALAAVVYLSLVGKEGIREVAETSLRKAHYTAKRLESVGFAPLFSGPFFNEFPVISPVAPEKVNEALIKEGIVGGLPLERFYPEFPNAMLFCVTEKRTREEIDKFIRVLEGSL